MIFKRLSASAARFNLRQSMQNLRDNVDQDEVLISDNGDVNPNKQRYMRQIVIDFGFLIEHWEIENKNPSKKIIRDFNEYLFSGNYGSNFSYFIAWMIGKLPDRDLVKVNMLLEYYSSNLKFNDYEKEWIILSKFVKDIIHHFQKVEENEFITKNYRDTFINKNSKIWFKEKSIDDQSQKEENPSASSEILNLSPELESNIESLWTGIKKLSTKCINYHEKNIDGAVGFYNWYLMFFITRFNENEKIIDLLNQTLFLMKVKLNKLEKYNHTKEIIEFIEENAFSHEKKIIYFKIFDKVCDHLSDLNLIFVQFAKKENKKEDQIAFQEASDNYKKLKELNEISQKK